MLPALFLPGAPAATGVSVERRRALRADPNRPPQAAGESDAAYEVRLSVRAVESEYGVDTPRADAAVRHFVDDQDVLTLLLPGADAGVRERVGRALLRECARDAELAEARRVVAADDRRRAEGAEIVHDVLQGGGKCKMPIGRTRDSLREEGGGRRCEERVDPAVAAARALIGREKARIQFP